MTPLSDSDSISEWGELRFLEWVREKFGQTDSRIQISLGDDGALIRSEGIKSLVVTTDALVEDVHFKQSWTPPRELGFKSMVANLSDLAAMAARPTAAILTLGIPPGTKVSDLKEFFLGLEEASKLWDCPLAGGDLVQSPQWLINLTLLGEAAVADRIIPRSGAKPGHTLYVTGWPGESAAGLDSLKRDTPQTDLVERHNRPTPRLNEAAILAEICDEIALIDVSDGIVNEAGHLAREGKVAIRITADLLPVSTAIAGYGTSIEYDPRNWVLFGGEDYELLFTTNLPIEKIQAAFKAKNITTPVAAIGTVSEGEGVEIVDAEGKPMNFTDRTFVHFG